MEQPSITCPQCHRTSYHPKDIEHKYCGVCGFHADLDPEESDLIGSFLPNLDGTKLNAECKAEFREITTELRRLRKRLDKDLRPSDRAFLTKLTLLLDRLTV